MVDNKTQHLMVYSLGVDIGPRSAIRGRTYIEQLRSRHQQCSKLAHMARVWLVIEGEGRQEFNRIIKCTSPACIMVHVRATTPQGRQIESFLGHTCTLLFDALQNYDDDDAVARGEAGSNDCRCPYPWLRKLPAPFAPG